MDFLDRVLVPGHRIGVVRLDWAVCSCGEKVMEDLPFAIHFMSESGGIRDICFGPITKYHCYDNRHASGIAKAAGMDERRNVYLCHRNHRGGYERRCLPPDQVWFLVES